MKQYLAVFLGKPEAMNSFRNLPEAERKEREQRGMQAWMKWVQDNQSKIKQMGSPLGKTLKVDRSGVAPTRNDLGGWTVVEAESHEDAAKLFAGHPHFIPRRPGRGDGDTPYSLNAMSRCCNRLHSRGEL